MNTEFSTFDIMRILNITRGQLREWIDSYKLKPSVQQSTGRGVSNIFSQWDLYGFAIFKKYKDEFTDNIKRYMLYSEWQKLTKSMHLSERAKIKHFVYLQNMEKGDKYGLKNVSVGKSYGVLLFDNDFSRLNKENFDLVFIINMERIIKETDKNIS